MHRTKRTDNQVFKDGNEKSVFVYGYGDLYGVEDARFIFSNGYIVLDFPNQQYMAWVCETPLCGFFI